MISWLLFKSKTLLSIATEPSRKRSITYTRFLVVWLVFWLVFWVATPCPALAKISLTPREQSQLGLDAARSINMIRYFLKQAGVQTEAVTAISIDLAKRSESGLLPRMEISRAGKEEFFLADGVNTGIKILSFSPMKLSYQGRVWTDRSIDHLAGHSTEQLDKVYFELVNFIENRPTKTAAKWRILPCSDALAESAKVDEGKKGMLEMVNIIALSGNPNLAGETAQGAVARFAGPLGGGVLAGGLLMSRIPGSLLLKAGATLFDLAAGAVVGGAAGSAWAGAYAYDKINNTRDRQTLDLICQKLTISCSPPDIGFGTSEMKVWVPVGNDKYAEAAFFKRTGDSKTHRFGEMHSKMIANALNEFAETCLKEGKDIYLNKLRKNCKELVSSIISSRDIQHPKTVVPQGKPTQAPE